MAVKVDFLSTEGAKGLTRGGAGKVRPMVHPSIPWEALLEEAKLASQAAYEPFSHFPVGAALLAKDGRIYRGCNVENVSFGLTLCAERSAISAMIAARSTSPELAGPPRDLIQALVVYTPTPTPTTPCGACRQVIAEFSRDIPVRCYCLSEEPLSATFYQLLPHHFSEESLDLS